MLKQLIQAHPQSVGETYLYHQQFAFGFSGALLEADLACFIHDLVPSLFQTTASGTIHRLHATMAARSNHANEPEQAGAELKPLPAR